MSQENLEIVRLAIDAWNRRDWDAILTLAAPDLAWDLTRAVGPLHGVYRADELRRIWTEFAELWERATIEDETLRDRGADVVVGMTIRARGRDGIEVFTRPAWIVSLRDGKLVRFTMFQDLEAAMAAVAPRPNVEVVREIYEAIERRDADAVLALYDPDVVWDFSRSPFQSVFKQTVYRGHDGIREFVGERYEEAWAEIVDRLDELIDLGEDVVTVVTSGGRGRNSGAEVELTHVALWSVRDGRVTRVAWFATREEAVAAAGTGA